MVLTGNFSWQSHRFVIIQLIIDSSREVIFQHVSGITFSLYPEVPIMNWKIINSLDLFIFILLGEIGCIIIGYIWALMVNFRMGTDLNIIIFLYLLSALAIINFKVIIQRGMFFYDLLMCIHRKVVLNKRKQLKLQRASLTLPWVISTV